jgi:hypothetical protein
MKDVYLLFRFNDFYPSGGCNDFIGCFDSLEAAEDAFDGTWESAHVALLHDNDLKIVSEGYGDPLSRKFKTINWRRTDNLHLADREKLRLVFKQEC